VMPASVSFPEHAVLDFRVFDATHLLGEADAVDTRFIEQWISGTIVRWIALQVSIAIFRFIAVILEMPQQPLWAIRFWWNFRSIFIRV
jgi:hypothetical protein